VGSNSDVKLETETMAKVQKATKAMIPLAQLTDTLRSYQAVLHRDVSDVKAHVYYSRPLQQWIAVMRKGDKAILTFTAECPCADIGEGRTPW
jgi:hypothetical protein